MGAHFEQTCECGHGIIRVYEGWNSYARRDPFALAIFVQRKGRSAFASGLRTNGFARRHWNAVNDCLAEQGFENLNWTEYKHGNTTPLPVCFPVIPLKGNPMSIDQSAQQADQHLAAAHKHAAKDKAHFSALIQAVQNAHGPALDLAKTENLPLGQRLRDPRLLALADATDALVAAGMSDPDQGHAIHHEIIKALHAMGDVADQVSKRERARLPQ